MLRGCNISTCAARGGFAGATAWAAGWNTPIATAPPTHGISERGVFDVAGSASAQAALVAQTAVPVWVGLVDAADQCGDSSAGATGVDGGDGAARASGAAGDVFDGHGAGHGARPCCCGRACGCGAQKAADRGRGGGGGSVGGGGAG